MILSIPPTEKTPEKVLISVKMIHKAAYDSKLGKQFKLLTPHRLLLNLTSKINLKGSDKYVGLSNHTKTINLKCQLQCGMIFQLPDGLCFLSDIQD